MRSADGLRYDRRTIALHWATAALVLFLWIWAHAIDRFPKGPLLVDARSIHIVVGAALLMVVGWRISWRWMGGMVIARRQNPAEQIAALVQRLLYILLLVTLALGLINTSVRGDILFGLVSIPPLGSYGADARHALSESITGWHAVAANAVLLVAGGHAAMALIHEFAWRDGRLQRMLPGGET